jgi:Lsr2
MTRRVLTTTEYTDDLDGSAADGTVLFGFDGDSYEIELSRSNAAAFADAIAPYLAHARKVTPGGRSGRRTKNPSDASAVRQWAKAHGYRVSQRGRVPHEILAAYDAAN